MSLTRSSLSVFFAGLIGFSFAISGAADAADTSARAGLAQASAEAKSWQKNAVLTGVGTPGANPDGASNLWSYDFYAPKTKKCATVTFTAHNGQTTIQEFPKCLAPTPISGDFVDSPKAIAEAKKGGFEPNRWNDMTLAQTQDRNAKGVVCWSVSSKHDFDPAKSVMRGWCVDPKTGKFVTRLSGVR